MTPTSHLERIAPMDEAWISLLHLPRKDQTKRRRTREERILVAGPKRKLSLTLTKDIRSFRSVTKYYPKRNWSVFPELSNF